MKYIANPVEVNAFVIIGNGPKTPDGSVELALQDHENVVADNGMIARYLPVTGDYYVVQSDGYAYVNPKEVFERKYSPAPAPSAPEPIPVPMGFASALSCLEQGEKVIDHESMSKGEYVVRQHGYPDGIPINKNTAEATGLPEGTVCKFRPYLLFRKADGSFVPWAPSIAQILSTRWGVIRS